MLVMKGIDHEEARRQRLARTAQIRRRSRGALALTKRRQQMLMQQQQQQEGYTIEQVDGAINTVKQRERDRSLSHKAEALASLKKWLSLPVATEGGCRAFGEPMGFCGTNEVVLERCAENGLCAALATEILDQACGKSMEDKVTLDAVCCVTNIACGSEKQTETTLCCAPYLLNFLESGHGLLVEQSIWALGNMGGESHKFREVLCNGGLIPALIKLMGQERQESRILRVAAWALGNFIRDKQIPVHLFVANNLHRVLLNILDRFRTIHVNREEQFALVETLSCLSLFTAREEEVCVGFIRENLVERMAPKLAEATLPRIHTRDLDLKILIPCLRIFANLIPVNDASGAPVVIRAAQASPDFLLGLARLISEDTYRFDPVLVKEALWTVSNVCALGGQSPTAHEKILVEHTPSSENLVEEQVFAEIMRLFLPSLAFVFTGGAPFDLQREAIHGLYNLVSRKDPRPLIELVKFKTSPNSILQVLFSMFLVNDVDIVFLALDLLELILAKLSNPFSASRLGKSGSQLVISQGGIDALEDLQFRPNVPEQIAKRASQLIDRYLHHGHRNPDESALMEDDETINMTENSHNQQLQYRNDATIGMETSAAATQSNLANFGFIPKR